MKKLWLILGLLIFVSACSDKQDEKNPEELTIEDVLEEGEQIMIQPNLDVQFDDVTYNYKIDELKTGCDKGSNLVCAIDLYAKCTLNHKELECDKNKLPRFVFMEDDNLGRPTEMTFKVVKIKPIDANMIEIYTQSTCNGTWFGLCNGNIIYVLNNKNNQWVVKDVYARDSF